MPDPHSPRSQLVGWRDRHDRLLPGRPSRAAVAELVKRRAKEIGLDHAPCAGHSLRAGHVTSADAAGAPESATMEQPRPATAAPPASAAAW